MRRPRLGPAAWTGLVLLTGFVAAALFASVVAPYTATARPGPINIPPSATHLLGTDDVGHDIFSQLVFGTRTSLTVGFAAAGLAVLVGAVLGSIAGYSRGRVDTLVARAVDVTLALPTLPLLVVLAAFLGRSLLLQIGVIALLAWARPARILRAEVLSARTRGHVEVAESMGAPLAWVVGRHLSHYIVPLLIPLFTRLAMIAILLEASLAFLGLGDPTRMSWGTMLFWANTQGAFLGEQWLWWILPPGLAIAALVVSLALIGLTVEERINPELAPRGAPIAATG